MIIQKTTNFTLIVVVVVLVADGVLDAEVELVEADSTYEEDEVGPQMAEDIVV